MPKLDKALRREAYATKARHNLTVSRARLHTTDRLAAERDRQAIGRVAK